MFYRDNAALLCLFSHVSSCFHDRPSDNPHMLHSNKTSQFLLLASLPWQPDSFLEPTFLLAYLTQSRGRRPGERVVSLLSVGMERNKHNSQKLLNTPDMISQASSHSRRPLLPTGLF